MARNLTEREIWLGDIHVATCHYDPETVTLDDLERIFMRDKDKFSSFCTCIWKRVKSVRLKPICEHRLDLTLLDAEGDPVEGIVCERAPDETEMKTIVCASPDEMKLAEERHLE